MILHSPFSIPPVAKTTADTVTTIPFPGKALEFDSPEGGRSVFPAPQRGFLLGPENRALEPVVRWIVDGEITRDRLPVLFYGPLGSGRSHLLQGILQAWRKNQTEKARQRRSYYLPASEFNRLYVEAIDTRTVEEFRRRYRQSALLILDDLEALADRPYILEELLHTLDSLTRRGGIVVLSSGVFPGEKPLVPQQGFFEALTARLVGGTTLPVFLPGQAVRRRFLGELATAFSVSLSGAALDLLALRLPLSLPKLYGVFAQMIFEAAGARLDVASLKHFLDRRETENSPRIDQIARRTAKHFSLKLGDLKGESRNKTIALARAVAVYLARQRTTLQNTEIARYFGNRDPSTIRHLIKKIEKDLPKDAALRDHLARLGDAE